MAADPIFVAPHYDDVALSSGALVSRFAANSAPVIVTVFAGAPTDSNFSPFAEQMHAEWGLSGQAAVEARRSEDRCATRALGDQVRAVWLDWTDAIYRDHRYASDLELFGEVLESDVKLVDQIADAIDQQGDGNIYLPLGVGNHVDHQIVFQAGLKLAAKGRTVFGYADLPYALVAEELDARLKQLGRPQRLEIGISVSDFERKWQAIECYRSQIPFILRDVSLPRSRFEKFMTASAGNGLVETVWILDPEQAV